MNKPTDKYRVVDSFDGVIIGTFTNLNTAWLEFKTEEGPLSLEPKTWADFGDSLAVIDFIVVPV